MTPAMSRTAADTYVNFMCFTNEIDNSTFICCPSIACRSRTGVRAGDCENKVMFLPHTRPTQITVTFQVRDVEAAPNVKGGYGHQAETKGNSIFPNVGRQVKNKL